MAREINFNGNKMLKCEGVNKWMHENIFERNFSWDYPGIIFIE